MDYNSLQERRLDVLRGRVECTFFGGFWELGADGKTLRKDQSQILCERGLFEPDGEDVQIRVETLESCCENKLCSRTVRAKTFQ